MIKPIYFKKRINSKTLESELEAEVATVLVNDTDF